MPRKRKAKKRECQYYPCGETKNLSECEYCKKLYCPTHIKPMIPMPAQFRSDKDSMDEWREIGRNGHPCPPAAEFLIQEKIRQKENEINTLTDILNKMKYGSRKVITFDDRELRPIPIPEPKPSLWERIKNWLRL